MMDKIIELFEKEKQSGKSARSILLELGLSEYDLKEWKSERSKPTVTKLLKIADYFQVSLDYLCGRTEENSTATAGLTPDESELITNYRLLDLKDKANIQGIIKTLTLKHISIAKK